MKSNKSKKLLLCALACVPFLLGCAGSIDSGGSGSESNKRYVVADTDWVVVPNIKVNDTTASITVYYGNTLVQYVPSYYSKLEYRCIDYSTFFTELYVRMFDKTETTKYTVDKYFGTNITVKQTVFEYGTITEE